MLFFVKTMFHFRFIYHLLKSLKFKYMKRKKMFGSRGIWKMPGRVLFKANYWLQWVVFIEHLLRSSVKSEPQFFPQEWLV